jgi:hypothetical protein
MKVATTIIFAAVLVLASVPSGHAGTDATPARPSIEVEILWTNVERGKTDLFVLVTNPNDFDVHVCPQRWMWEEA